MVVEQTGRTEQEEGGRTHPTTDVLRSSEGGGNGVGIKGRGDSSEPMAKFLGVPHGNLGGSRRDWVGRLN